MGDASNFALISTNDNQERGVYIKAEETVTSWPYWSEGQLTEPYSVDAIRVVNSERSGGPSNVALPHFRMNACNSTATAIEESPVQPPKFVLMAPYPNPVSASSSTIPFSVDQSGPVTIAVYDVLGRRVATILDQDRLPAGPREVRWSAGDLPSGVYFVKLKAAQKSVSRKITIVR